MNKHLIRETTDFFKVKFNQNPTYLVSSPGRINLIGEHIDYNDGSVLLGTIDKIICFAVSKANTDISTIIAKDLGERVSFRLNENNSEGKDGWTGYFCGVLDELKKRALRIENFNLVFSSNIPMGSGLSSSAALECGFAFALNVLFDLKLTKLQIVQIGQQAENNFAGVQCGIMDQFASIFGRKNRILQLNCNTLETEYHRMQLDQYSLILLNSGVKHTLLDSSYNNRREECSHGLAIFKKHFPHVKTFRDCTENQLNSIKVELGDKLFKRCHYVIQEINRVPEAFDALKQQDFVRLGKLLYESHKGLNELYEVSCEELNYLVERTFDEPAVLGARMMGGGFGGCTINLIEKKHKKEWISKIKKNYKRQFGIPLQSYRVKLSNGTSCIDVESDVLKNHSIRVENPNEQNLKNIHLYPKTNNR